MIKQISPKAAEQKVTPRDNRLYTSNDSAISLGDMPIIIQKSSTNVDRTESINDRREDSDGDEGSEISPQ